LIDQDRNPKEILTRGKHKSIQTDRVILVPGPESETQVVREVYDFSPRNNRPKKTLRRNSMNEAWSPISDGVGLWA